MPWRESSVVNERMRFVLRLENGERMTELCREFGISRKTGYKLWDRYRVLGPVGLFDESRAPERVPHRTSKEVEELIVALRRERPSWGPKKLRAVLERERPGIRFPALSTFDQVLRRNNLIVRRRRRRGVPPHDDGVLTNPGSPNDVWCADFKGQFRLGSGRYCYPLTITDRVSRLLIVCEGLDDTRTEPAQAVFTKAFREYGLPRVIRTDNGSPFASRGLAGLTRLSAWWIRLGIRPERIEPGHPEQNGQHERMHLTLKQETTRPAAAGLLQQQERFDRFRELYNRERPHEGLGQRMPAEVHQNSTQKFPHDLPELTYPLHDVVRAVARCGHIGLGPRRFGQVFLSSALAGERVGLREVEDGRWLISFASLDLGIADVRTKTFEPTPSPRRSPRQREPGGTTSVEPAPQP